LARIDEFGRQIPTPILPKDKVDLGVLMSLASALSTSRGIWRRRIMDQVGLLDESLIYSLDYHTGFRMALAGGKFKRSIQLWPFFA